MRLIDADKLQERLGNVYITMQQKSIKEEIQKELLACCGEIEQSKTVDAIPIEWIENYFKDNMLMKVKLMIDDWRKENGNK